MAYSQNNEQEVILNYFKDFTGTVLDIGANDGKTLSNSLALIELGWSGVLYEPSPSAFKSCKELHKLNPKVTVINKAVSDKAETLTFYDCENTLVSSSVIEIIKQWNQKYNKITVEAVPYSDIKCKPDFINIDAEGMDLIILKQIDLTDVKMICLEHGNSFEKEAKQYCEGYGMKQVIRNFENIIMAR